jgi:hypothetical protein
VNGGKYNFDNIAAILNFNSKKNQNWGNLNTKHSAFIPHVLVQFINENSNGFQDGQVVKNMGEFVLET